MTVKYFLIKFLLKLKIIWVFVQFLQIMCLVKFAPIKNNTKNNSTKTDHVHKSKSQVNISYLGSNYTNKKLR